MGGRATRTITFRPSWPGNWSVIPGGSGGGHTAFRPSGPGNWSLNQVGPGVRWSMEHDLSSIFISTKRGRATHAITFRPSGPGNWSLNEVGPGVRRPIVANARGKIHQLVAGVGSHFFKPARVTNRKLGRAAFFLANSHLACTDPSRTKHGLAGGWRFCRTQFCARLHTRTEDLCP